MATTTLAALLLGLGATQGAQARGIPASGVIDLASDADATLTGAAAGEQAGWAVTAVGDVNGDGHQDVAVGSPKATAAGRSAAGAVRVVFGPISGTHPLASGPGFTVEGATEGDALGTSVAPAGDVNGDGLADLVVGAPRADLFSARPGTGAAYVVFGKAGGDPVDTAALGAGGMVITGAQDGDQAGVAVAGVGDVDGDGTPDVAIGSPRADRGGTDAGAVDVVFGLRAGGAVDLAKRTAHDGYAITGTPGSLAGTSLAPLADVNADGVGDLVVGAPVRTRERAVPGAAYVVFGRRAGGDLALDALTPADGIEISGHSGDLFGISVGTVDDLNGDGRRDLTVGAQYADTGDKVDTGAAYVVFTPPAGTASVDVSTGPTAAQGLRIDGANSGEATGATATGVGDLDGDGSPDMVVTSPFAGTLGRAQSGVAYVVAVGKAVDTKATEPVRVNLAGLGALGFRVAGADAGGFIRAAAPAGDLDGDGGADLLVGAIAGRAGESDPSTGTVSVVLGSTPPPPAPVLPPDPGVAEEVAAGCRAATQLEIILDDSGSMQETDEGNLRAKAVQLLLAKPRNIAKQLGAVEFGDTSDELFPPQAIRDPVTDPSQSAQIAKLLDETVVADNGSTDYNAGFAAGASAAPKADARVFLTDGEHNAGEYMNGHRGGPPTYVVGLDIGRKGEAGARLQRIAKETGGRYFPNVTSEKLQPVINAIDSQLNCDVGLDSFVDALSDGDQTEPNDVDLDADTESADIDVSWEDPDDVATPGDLEVLDEDGDVVATLSARAQRVALHRASSSRRFGRFTVRGRRGRTFYSLRVTGLHGARLRIRTASHKGSMRVHTQVSQSRRRR